MKSDNHSEVLWAIMTAALVGLAVVCMILIGQKMDPGQSEVDLSGVFVQQPSHTYEFHPKPDITAYELALSIHAMMGAPYYVERAGKMIDAFPPNVRRHWIGPKGGPSEHAHEH